MATILSVIVADLGALGGRNKEVTWATILEKAMLSGIRSIKVVLMSVVLVLNMFLLFLPATGKV